jgi:Asp-tRNA(Asn)/Glu-tRNA(Gln) amidotransferase A subunit family amidase
METLPDDMQPGVSRRTLLRGLTVLGVGTATFRRALAAQAAQAGAVTPTMIKQAEWIAGLELTDDERSRTARTLARSLRAFADLRKVDVGYDVPPALTFLPVAPRPAAGIRRNQARPAETATTRRPSSAEELAFLPVTELSALIRSRQVSSTELTKLYLDRLKRFDPLLKCVVTLTEDLAIKQAANADKEIASGHFRGPLHGIPWGAKDLIAYPGYPTTWGATPFKDRIINETATVATRLEEAGAVMLAKLSLGALAMGDQWFRGRTRSPWDPRTGSSGSSAGSASAVAAGLVGFAIGSETLGSIVSPCRACGASGLRPTFGRVSRYGCMTLSWTMDKLGPIARSIEDCALVFDAIHGADGKDWAAVDQPFDWPPTTAFEKLKIGYIQEPKEVSEEREELKVLRKLGFELVPITLPDELPIQAITLMLGTEAAAVFDELTRKHITQGLNTWPDTFRNGQFVPAIEYLRAARVRTKLMRAMAERMAVVDLYVGSGEDLPITNLTGHPSVVFPIGFHDRAGRRMPGSVTLTGRLYDETTLLSVAHAFQQATGDHRKRPPLEEYLAEHEKQNEQEKRQTEAKGAAG